jgi:hypothetical protein
MPVGPITIVVRQGETRVKSFLPTTPTNVTGMTWRLLIRTKGSDDTPRVRTSGAGLTITAATGQVDWTIDTTDTATAGDFEFELERTNAGAEIDVVFGDLVVVAGMVA